MSRKSLLLWGVVIGIFAWQASLAQDNSAIWNQAKRWKLGIDPLPPTFSQPSSGAVTSTMNPLSPPNAPDVQVFNPSNFWQSENSIGVNFTNANQLMVSTNGQIPGSNPVVQQPWAFSTDGGATWPASLQSESIPPGIVDCFGDPVAFFDRSGRAFYSTLGSPGGIYFVSTTNFGATWSARSNADNLSSTNDDKQHAAADYSNTFPNNVYTAWTDFGVTPNIVQFARSTNSGTSWLPRVGLGIGSDRGQGTHLAIGPNGEVYVIWADYTSGTAEVGIGMAKSTDGGATFNTPAVAFPINGTRISNGAVAQLNGVRTSSFPYADVDRSNGPRRGWVYVVAPELDVALTGQSDIYIHRSTNGGTTWSGPIKVNGPDVSAGKWQFQASIAVDPTTGGISVAYFSMDSTGSNFMANRYVAYSVDGGTTWDNFVVSDVRALWAIQGTPNTNTTYNGDYSEIAATNGKAWPVWQDRRSGATGSSNRAYVQTITYSENFGWIRGTVTSLGTSTAVSGAAIDFVQPVLQ
ncbi:MAG: sialidase family protein, partial [bacterium]